VKQAKLAGTPSIVQFCESVFASGRQKNPAEETFRRNPIPDSR
jgi:hypothetical protein